MAKGIIYKDGKPIGELDTESEQYIRGFGDLFHLVANPIAKAIDKVAGTDLQNCGACKDRREDWNKEVPFK